MVDSRLRVDPLSLFHCVVSIAKPTENNECDIKFIVPNAFEDKDIVLKQIKQFCYPCEIDHDGVQYSTFVLTDLESKFRFGFCRYPPHAQQCLCLVSYLPWFETFYAVLDKTSKIDSFDHGLTLRFLETLNEQSIPSPGSKLFLKLYSNKEEEVYKFVVPDTTKLPCIPENRNLTEYFSKVTPENMVNLFICMLFERRIIVTSVKLSVLTAVVHGSVSLLYPMQWQHIFIPILPPQLIDYCSAPMPFLVGVHSSLMERVYKIPLDDVVIFDADTNELLMNQTDRQLFPAKIAFRLQRKLEKSDKAFSDYVSSQFLNALVDMIGGYRDALKFAETKNGGKIVFDETLFVNTRSGSKKIFLEQILHLQSFRQFIANRVDMMNDAVDFVDIFERAVMQREQDHNTETKFNHLKDKMKKGGNLLQKTVNRKYSHLKGVANEIEIKDLKKKIKDKYKDVKDSIKNKDNTTEIEVIREANVKRNNSMPVSQSKRVMNNKNIRYSMYSTMPIKNTPKPGKTPPPRPPRPPEKTRRSFEKEPNSLELPRKEFLNVTDSARYVKSNSEANIVDLMDVDTLSNHGHIDSSSLSSHSADWLNSSGSELSLEHFNSYANPAFSDPHSTAVIDTHDEGPIMEHRSLSPTNCTDDGMLVVNASSKSAVKLLTTNAEEKNKNGEKEKESNSCQTGLQPTAQRLMRPLRPPPPTAKSVKENEVKQEKRNNDFLEDSFIVLHESDRSKDRQYKRPSILNPTSPFYTPSHDLLELDQSLFHETMQSLSENTRQLMSRNINDSHESSPQTGEVTCDIVEFSGSPLVDVNITFDQPSQIVDEFENFTRSAVMTNNPFAYSRQISLRAESSLQNSTTDPFASMFEDAKRDINLNRK